MHVVGGVGWAVDLLRDSLPPYDVAAELAADSGCGETSYTAYDRRHHQRCNGLDQHS